MAHWLSVGLAVAAVACGSPPAALPTAALPTDAHISASPTPARQNVVFIVEGVTSEVAAAVRVWAERAGWTVREGPEDDLSEKLALGELAFVVSRGMAGWAADPAFVDAGVKGVDVDSDVAPQQHLSVIGRTGLRWEEAGFLAGGLGGFTGAGKAVGMSTSADEDGLSALLAGFDQGVRYACPKCDVLTQDGDAFDPDELIRSGVDGVFVTPGDSAEETARRAAEAGLWIIWLGEVPADLPADRLAGRVRLAPEALVGTALQSLVDGGTGQSWSYSVETESLLLADLHPEAISPGKQRLALEAWEKLQQGLLQVVIP
jgi:hypothetical protein